MIALRQATDNAALEPIEDQRRLTESDPDFVRLHARTQRRLMSSIRQAVRDVKSAQAAAPTQRSGLLNEAINSFVQRHLALLKAAYEEAHAEGQVDYWHAVSNVPGKQQLIAADTPTLRKRLAFYAPSVAKMARELSVLGVTTQTPRIAAETRTAAEFDVVKLYNPNHDAKGRFATGGGAKTTVAKGQGRTRRGEGGKRVKNSTGASKTIAWARSHPAETEQHITTYRDVTSDTLMNRMARELGYNAPAGEVSPSEMSRLVDNPGATEFYRSVSSPIQPGGNEQEAASRAQANAQQFSQGEYRVGTGVYGSGYYAGTGPQGLSIAQGYAASQGYSSVVQHGVLMPGSRIGEFGTLASQMYSAGRGFLRAAGVTDATGLSASDRGEYNLLYRNVGRFAAHLGFDAIHEHNSNYLVILNRGAAVVQNSPV